MSEELVFIIMAYIANVIGFIYMIPQLYQTIKTKKTRDLSGLFINLRIICSILWIIYTINYEMWQVLASWVITFISSLILAYYKFFYKQSIRRERSNAVTEITVEI